jgi:hypothetical protein
VELTLPEGSSKGQEQFAAFQMVCVSLETEEVRVLVTRCGIVHPESPMVTVGSVLVSGVFHKSDITAETIPLGGVTSCHESGCLLDVCGKGGGRGDL